MALPKDNIAQAELLWQQYNKLIHRSLLSYEADPQLREDLAQNVFIALLSSADRMESISNVKAYLLRIVHNVAVTHINKEVRRSWVSLDHELIDGGENPEQLASSDSDSSQLLAAVRKLKLPYRQVMVLLLEDFSDLEIADILGISHSNVRVRINRAKSQLMSALHAAQSNR